VLIAVVLPALCFLAAPTGAASEDSRIKVTMPEMMQQHMLANMRDHLRALTEIQAALGRGQYDRAADIAESRLGMTSLDSHGASHMAPHMPQGMQEIGSQMHRAASRFALTAQEAAVDGNAQRAIAALSKVTQQCVACHSAYRLH
jgi:cytochrome c556